MAKKAAKQAAGGEASTNLRRSTRTTRGSIKPLVDLHKEDDNDVTDEACVKEEVGSGQDEFVPETKRKSSARKSMATRQIPAKKELAKRKSGGKVVSKRESKQEQEPAEMEESKGEHLGDDDELANDGTYYELSEAELKEINHAFNMNRLSDVDENLDTDGLRTAIRSLGFEPRGDEIKKLLKKFSKKGGKVSRDGFHQIMAFKFGSSPGTKLNNLNDEISRVFNLLDLDKTGFITLENLKSISKELNEELTDEDILEMVQEADLDGDNMINKVEFERIMKKTSLY